MTAFTIPIPKRNISGKSSHRLRKIEVNITAATVVVVTAAAARVVLVPAAKMSQILKLPPLLVPSQLRPDLNCNYSSKRRRLRCRRVSRLQSTTPPTRCRPWRRLLPSPRPSRRPRAGGAAAAVPRQPPVLPVATARIVSHPPATRRSNNNNNNISRLLSVNRRLRSEAIRSPLSPNLPKTLAASGEKRRKN